MVEFKNNIVQLGFGAVGKSFFEKVFNEINFDREKYFVISKDKLEHSFFVELGGTVNNFIVADINKNNFELIFSKYLNEGDLLIDFADEVGTKDFVKWCANRNVMYINTGEADWSDNWYNIFDENIKKNNLRESLSKLNNVNRYPIVIHHGNNPGLVSHFVKAGIEYIVKKQFKNNKKLYSLLKENKFNELAKELDLKQIHVNDIDFQQIKDNFYDDKLYSTWSVDSFFFEMLSHSTANIGTNEKIDYENDLNRLDLDNGFLEFKDLAINKNIRTYYPKGSFNAFLVPHEETISIAKSLEVKDKNKVIYRPTVVFAYLPCEYAVKYLINAKVNENFNKDDNISIVRGYKYPKYSEIVYKENIQKGTEFVGVLLLGGNFDPVWVGNRVKTNYLYKSKKSFWQTPTITPVSMSALSAVCWMIKNKDKGGIYFPDDILDYKDIIHFAEKYISKTIYKTINRKKLEKVLNINLDSLQLNDILK